MYKKIYDFKVNMFAYGHDIHRANGYNHDVNTSGILSRLIQEAGRFCEYYASDLFIDWQRVEKTVETIADGESKVFLFGFRQSGVDHDSFILSHFCGGGDESHYRSMWRLDIEAIADEINMTLGRVF